MSTTSLPSYGASSSMYPTPSYTARPQGLERRLGHVDRPRTVPLAEFIKNSKNGEVRLRLFQQQQGIAQPVYGSGSAVEGSIDLSKTEGVTSVEIQIEGTLRLKEIGEGGTSSSKLCLNRAILWVKDRTNGSLCPPSLSFKLSLPSTFMYGKESYPLPPTYEVHLSGVPGFRANVDYSLSVMVNKPNIKSVFGITIGNTGVSTAFIYQPRTRPAVPLPSPLRACHNGVVATSEWRLFDSRIQARFPGGQDIISKLYVPTSRIFCVHQPIPFHIMFSSSAFSLASFLPLTPTASLLSPNKQYTGIQLLRQSTVDVRNTTTMGTKTDIWRVDRIGKGLFKHSGDGPDWIAFVGEIIVSDQVKIGGFKAGGLSVKDCIVLSMDPPDPGKSPFGSLRQVVPVRLTTDPWFPDGSELGVAFGGSEYSISSSPDELAEAPPELYYNV